MTTPSSNRTPRVPKGYRQQVDTPEGNSITVRSTLEADALNNLTERSVYWMYEDEKLHYTIKARYTPDITLATKSGSVIYVECKGWFKPEDRRKLKAVRDCNPGIDIRLLFSNPNKKIAKRSKTSYAQWCDKNGFKWTRWVVPQEWLDE